VSTDLELLEQYARDESQDAFAELVKRYITLVYRAALRQLEGNVALAEDVTQVVFTTLATKAAVLNRKTILAGWLYTTTHHLVANARRAEQRRRARDHQAYLMHASSAESGSAAEWNQLRHLLDAAVHQLQPADREAVVLRFFAGHDFSEIGLALGISHDAARKRVERALEKLRAQLTARGITTAMAALPAALAGETTAVPAGLAASVTKTALIGSAAVATAAVTTAGVFGLTAMIKIGFACAMVGLAAVGALEWQHRRQVRALETALEQVNRQHAALLGQLAAQPAVAPETPTAAASAPAISPLVNAAATLVEQVDDLKQQLAARPDQQIPELKLVPDSGWIAAATAANERGVDPLQIFHQLRNYGKARLALMLPAALASYAAANAGQLPSDILQLLPFVEPPIDAAMLQRYQVIRSGRLEDMPLGLPVIGEIASVPGAYDSVMRVSKNGSSVSNVPDAASGDVERAADAFAREHQGQAPAEAAEVRGYLKLPIDDATLRRIWAIRSARASGQRVRIAP
jgi:RNA polymerase sigma factor (sigma-70 family)